MLHPHILTIAVLAVAAATPALAGTTPLRPGSALEAERQQDIELISRKLQEARTRLAQRRQSGAAKSVAEPRQAPAGTPVLR